jgi:hypothetical protein
VIKSSEEINWRIYESQNAGFPDRGAYAGQSRNGTGKDEGRQVDRVLMGKQAISGKRDRLSKWNKIPMRTGQVG